MAPALSSAKSGRGEAPASVPAAGGEEAGNPWQEAEDLFRGNDDVALEPGTGGARQAGPSAPSWALFVAATAGIAVTLGLGVWVLPPLWQAGDVPPSVVLELPEPSATADAVAAVAIDVSDQAAPPAGATVALEPGPVVVDRGGGVTIAAVARSTAATEPSLAALVRRAPPLDPAVTEDGRDGPLPRIADDGRTPLAVYARPTPAGDARPRVALVVADIGLSAVASEAAIRRLPADVTLAIDPYADDAAMWAAAARGGGREILMALPTRSYAFPFRDPGPAALQASAAASGDDDRLMRLMAQFGGYVGVFNPFGQRLEATEESLRPIAGILGDRGLSYIGGMGAGATALPALARDLRLPVAAADLWIDATPAAESIGEALASLEEIARQRGVAVGMGRPLPLTIDRVAEWAKGLEERGVVLVPISGVVGLQVHR
ncbi:MAG: divergent polysaccharide deacetylase family protein [Rhodospirillales bacterium]|nr:MAG: divergent polysaccharide deacetylase family protein [Rhodospirillales bacterium]